MLILAIIGAALIGTSFESRSDYKMKIESGHRFWFGLTLVGQWLLLGIYEIFFQ